MPSHMECVRRDRLYANIRANASEFKTADFEKEVQQIQDLLVILEYFSRPNHRGGVMMPEQSPERRQLADGMWIDWSHVGIEKAVDGAEKLVEKFVPAEKKAEVWEKLFEGCDEARRNLKLQPSKYEKLTSEWSVSKAGKPVSNTELFDRLSSITGIEEAKKKFYLNKPVFIDAGLHGRQLAPDGSIELTKTGRLGRKHTLEDCPNHFVRDFIMDVIQVDFQSDEDRIAAVIFDDLNESERQAYSAHIANKRKEEFERTACLDAAEEKDASKVVSFNGRRNVAEQMLELDGIDDTIDVTPRGPCGSVDWECNEPLKKSVIRPDKPVPPEQKAIACTSSIDRDCDQIRACIARLIKYSEEGWTLDSFRRTMVGINERKPLIDFLKKRGRRGQAAGQRSSVYQLAGNFFKLRDLLGIPVPSPTDVGSKTKSPSDKPVDKKRKRGPLEERDANESQQDSVGDGKRAKSAKTNKEVICVD